MPRPYASKNLPLRPLTKTNASKRKQYRLGQVFQLPKLSDIPAIDFELDDNPIENQLLKADTLDDMCGAYALTSVLESIFGIQFDPGYTQAKIKQLQGDPSTWGATLEELADVARKFGALPLSKSPFPDRPRSFVSDWKNWDPIYDEYAALYKVSAYVWVDGPYDTFDNVLATLWYLKNLPPGMRGGILTGSYWYPEWQYAAGGVIPTTVSSRPTGHAFRERGQKIINGERRIALQNSYGTDVGFQGKYFLPREAMKETKPFGHIVFVSNHPEEIKAQKLGLIGRILQLIQTTIYFLKLDSLPKAEPAPVVPEPEPTPAPVSELYEYARTLIGKDASPKDTAVDGLGCAESVSTIIHALRPTFPVVTGTWTLFDLFRKSPLFDAVKPTDLAPGDIILCVTGQGNGRVSNGHVGIFGEGNSIMSNDSRTGLWQTNFTLLSWISYYATKGGYPVYYYRLKPN